MHVTLINPNICMQEGDLFGTGIPYMPMSLAWVAGYLRHIGTDLQVIDAFGEKPLQIRAEQGLRVQGLTTKEIISRIPKDTKCICIYAAKVVAHEITKQIVAAVRKEFACPIVILENTQSVVAYSLRVSAPEFFAAGADYLLAAESEYRLEKLIHFFEGKGTLAAVDGLIYKRDGITLATDKQGFIRDLDALPFPAWDLFPLQNYWNLGYAHGPLESKKYLPLLTSRGCPYGCRYCVVPETNARRWRYRSAQHVVDEIEHWIKTLGVHEFHWEDLNPTIRKDRMVKIAQEILNRKLKIVWKLVAGTKVETMDKDTITWMAKAGCTYISISPESGSQHVLKLMDKPFDHEKGLELAKHMYSLGITTQACFVLGFPGETKKDLQKTRTYMRKLVRAGIDEVAFFIMTPIPGSKTFSQFDGYSNLSQLTFTPTWRRDFRRLSWFRTRSYLEFYFLKLLFHPLRLLRQPFLVLTRRFKTKTEMTVFRTVKLLLTKTV